MIWLSLNLPAWYCFLFIPSVLCYFPPFSACFCIEYFLWFCFIYIVLLFRCLLNNFLVVALHFKICILNVSLTPFKYYFTTSQVVKHATPEAEVRLAESSYESQPSLHTLHVHCLSQVSNSGTCSLSLPWIELMKCAYTLILVCLSLPLFLSFSPFIFPYPWAIKGAMMWKWRFLTFKVKERCVWGGGEYMWIFVYLLNFSVNLQLV